MTGSTAAEAQQASFRQCQPSSLFPVLAGLACWLPLLLFLLPGCGEFGRPHHRLVPGRLVYLEAEGGAAAAKWRLMEMPGDGSCHQVTGYRDYNPGVLRVAPGGDTVVLLAAHGEAVYLVSLPNGTVVGVAAPKGYLFRESLACAPSGREIACAAGPEGHNPRPGASLNLLVLINTETHSASILVGKTTALDGPTWSPDGHAIAFATSNGIETIHPDGTARRRLVASTVREGRGEAPSFPAWCPNGHTIALVGVSFPDGKTSLDTVDVNHKSQRSLDSCDFTTPMWSPDGRYLLYGKTDAQGIRRLAGIEFISGKQVDLSSKDSSLFGLSWSHDGKALLALRADTGRTASVARLVVVAFPSGRETVLDTGRGLVGAGAWVQRPL